MAEDGVAAIEFGWEAAAAAIIACITDADTAEADPAPSCIPGMLDTLDAFAFIKSIV
jgi:hypothetical protein